MLIVPLPILLWNSRRKKSQILSILLQEKVSNGASSHGGSFQTLNMSTNMFQSIYAQYTKGSIVFDNSRMFFYFKMLFFLCFSLKFFLLYCSIEILCCGFCWENFFVLHPRFECWRLFHSFSTNATLTTATLVSLIYYTCPC